MKPPALLLVLMCGMTACSIFTHQSPAEQAAISQCRQHADKVYAQQNPDAVYRADAYANGGRDTPNATYGLMGVSGAGLGGEYDRNQVYENCLVENGIAPQAPVSKNPQPVAP